MPASDIAEHFDAQTAYLSVRILGVCTLCSTKQSRTIDTQATKEREPRDCFFSSSAKSVLGQALTLRNYRGRAYSYSV